MVGKFDFFPLRLSIWFENLKKVYFFFLFRERGSHFFKTPICLFFEWINLALSVILLIFWLFWYWMLHLDSHHKELGCLNIIIVFNIVLVIRFQLTMFWRIEVTQNILFFFDNIALFTNNFIHKQGKL